MPRVSAEEKTRSHARIVQEASKLLRSKGFEDTSVSDVMRAAGLTHGGFYRHFESKDALMAAALDHAIRNAVSVLASAETPQERAKALQDYIALYLSHEHVQDVANGCPLAALAADAGRGAETVKQTAADGMQHVIEVLAKAMGGPDHLDRAKALLALLVGTVTLARITQDPYQVQTTLNAAKTTATALISPKAQHP